jgi:small subunit ribosomal protein S13
MGVTNPRGKKEEYEKKKEEKPKVEVKKRKVIEGVRGIVRVAEKDVEGDKKIAHALLKIKGVGQSLAKAITHASGLDPNLMIGSLTDEQLEKLEDVIRNPAKYGIPIHMLNRRNDPFLGVDRHVVSSELVITQRGDIDFMKIIKSYKGIRHGLGLPVRGQRTRSSFRGGGMVGVAKGAARAAMKAGAKPAAPTAAPAKPGAAPVAKAAPAAKAPAKETKKEEKK